MQSPVGLVPKQEPDHTRLIFHLSHPQGGSINCHTPEELCTVKYDNIQQAVNLCLEASRGYIAKSDMKYAFRNLPIRSEDWK